LPVLRQAWERFLATRTSFDLERVIEYTNSKGEHYASKIADVLMHVVMHGAYHRGQIAASVREHGGEPAYTDYIQAVRTGKIS
jgi:uncharacterized damage-inducible protein DinB